MRSLLSEIYILAVLVISTPLYCFAYLPTAPTQSSSTPTPFNSESKIITSLETSSQENVQTFRDNPSTTANAISQPAGRNLQFPSFHEDVLEVVPIQNNFDMIPDYKRPILDVGPALPPFEPFHFDDTIDVGAAYPFSLIFLPQPMDDPRITYPLDIDEGVVAATGRQIVFRPLFAYRRQSAQRRRIYSKPSSSSTSYKYAQRRQGYPYRYSSYSSYPYQYPNYYYNAPYDAVP